ncbi:hypothetical protein ACWEO2_34925 [Nocardia sp. NPDC004278]
MTGRADSAMELAEIPTAGEEVGFRIRPDGPASPVSWWGRTQAIVVTQVVWSAAEQLHVPGLLTDLIQLHVRLIGPVVRPCRLIFGLLRQLAGLFGLILRRGGALLTLIGLCLGLLRLTVRLIGLILGLLRLTYGLLRLTCGLLRLLTSLLCLLNRLHRTLVRHLCLMMYLPCLRLCLTGQGGGLGRGLAGVLRVRARLIAECLALDLRHFRVPPGHIELVARAGHARRPCISFLSWHYRTSFRK